MRQYNLAFRTLNDALDNSARSSELAILGSIAFVAFEVLWGVDTRVKMHLDGALAMLGSLSENSVDERKSQTDSSLGYPSGSERHRWMGLGYATDFGYLASAVSRLNEQVSSFGTLSNRE